MLSIPSSPQALMHGSTVKLSTMAVLTASIPSSPVIYGQSSVDLNTGIRYGSFSRARLNNKLDGGGALLSSVHGLKQTHGLSGKVVGRKCSKGVAVRSQVRTDVEPTVGQNVETGDSVHKVVIVGAGIAGLSAAVALHRVGVNVLVLEQSDSIRASGLSLTLWGNAWRALEYLGVAEELRKKHSLATGICLFNRSEKLLKKFDFSDCPGGPHEVRGVERKLLIESLASQLPAGSIQVKSRVHTIHREPEQGLTKVELENGSVISTKVLVGCDGVNSVVGRWMGLRPTRYVGQIGYRGVAEYPDGHEFGSFVRQYLGNGARCGIFPFSPSKVYWFGVVNRRTPGPKVTDRNVVKAEVLELVKAGWPEKMKELVNNTPAETMSRAALTDRWNIPGIIPPLVKEGVTLAGDALHPMTPNLGQGGCTAIEDGIVLARTLGALLQQGGGDAESIQKALEDYTAERQKRTFSITVKSFVFGLLLGIGFAPVVFIRDNLAVPKLVRPRSFLSHTLYDVGKLPSSTVKVQ